MLPLLESDGVSQHATSRDFISYNLLGRHHGKCERCDNEMVVADRVFVSIYSGGRSDHELSRRVVHRKRRLGNVVRVRSSAHANPRGSPARHEVGRGPGRSPTYVVGVVHRSNKCCSTKFSLPWHLPVSSIPYQHLVGVILKTTMRQLHLPPPKYRMQKTWHQPRRTRPVRRLTQLQDTLIYKAKKHVEPRLNK